jgi:hypothetical protein
MSKATARKLAMAQKALERAANAVEAALATVDEDGEAPAARGTRGRKAGTKKAAPVARRGRKPAAKEAPVKRGRRASKPEADDGEDEAPVRRTRKAKAGKPTAKGPRRARAEKPAKEGKVKAGKAKRKASIGDDMFDD